MIGEELGSYRLEALLGRGGFGAVYRATGPSGDQVALKILSSEAALDESAVARFEQEAVVLRRLAHPNIVCAVSDLEREGEKAYYAMELVHGPSIADLIRTRGRLLPGEAVAATLGVLGALDAAHRMDVVHRDIKPSNVLVGPGGQVKVCDFGLARALDATRLTLSGQVVGTPAYLSPEQADGETSGPPTDLYACGILLYEALAGHPPFRAESPLAVLRMHCEREPEPPPVADLPEGLWEACRKALAKEPGDRWETAAAFAHALGTLEIFSPADGKDGIALLAELTATGETATVVTEMGGAEGTTEESPDGPGAEEAPAGTPPDAEGPEGPPGENREAGEPVEADTASRGGRRLWIGAALAILVGLGVLVLPARKVSRTEAGTEATLEVRSESDPVRGEIVEIDGENVRVQRPDGSLRTIPRSELVRIHYGTGE